MIEWCFYAAFNSISVISAHIIHAFLGFTSTRKFDENGNKLSKRVENTVG